MSRPRPQNYFRRKTQLFPLHRPLHGAGGWTERGGKAFAKNIIRLRRLQRVDKDDNTASRTLMVSLRTAQILIGAEMSQQNHFRSWWSNRGRSGRSLRQGAHSEIRRKETNGYDRSDTLGDSETRKTVSLVRYRITRLDPTPHTPHSPLGHFPLSMLSFHSFIFRRPTLGWTMDQALRHRPQQE